ncbi:PAS/PAC sensor signal transduction histidine kinase [Desulfatibacillum aliphaticivorans]|uniref:histidine kinase n=1 Tax=Desulfatibacillum aliphaticivorans TaxID=218208 RepID=B8FFM2_DESAL|nr:PAS domain S-box protein [Desulfatibacillum aliphaticivorans]ACL01716.1 PAS/PAC sensor signal transduction histidine kinase [Desulfatibacillum aliphaticivorans]
MTIKSKIFAAGAVFFIVFVLLAFMSIWTQHEVLANRNIRDSVDKKLADIQEFEEWKTSLIRSVSDIAAQEHVPPLAREQFLLPAGQQMPGYDILSESGLRLVDLIASKEKASADIDEAFDDIRIEINSLYYQLDDRISTVLAILQLERVMGGDASEKGALAPYVLKSLNQLTLVALNSLISRNFSNEHKSVVMKNQRFVSSQLELIDSDGSLLALFSELFAQIESLERLIGESDATLLRYQTQIAEAREAFDSAAKSTEMNAVVAKAKSDLDAANVKLENASRSTLTAVFVFLFLVPLLVIIFGIFGLNTIILRPISQLMHAMKRVEDGAFDVAVPIRAKDEIGKLAWAFNAMAAEITSKVAEMSRLNQGLRESESKYKTLVNNIPQRIFLKDKNFKYVSCNRNYAQDVNMTEAQIEGKNDFDLFPMEIAEKYRSDDERILSAGESEEIEESYIKDGETMVVQTVKIPIRDDAGEVSGVLGIFWDITERRKMEESLRITRFSFENAPLGIYLIGEGRRILDVNEAAARMLGYTREELASMGTWEVDPFQAKLDDEAAWNIAKAQKEGECFESVHLRQDGSEVPVEVSSSLFEYEGLRYAVAFIQDITQRKQAEEELRKSRRLLSNILESMDESVATIDQEFVYQLVNRRHEECFDQPRRDVVGRTVWDLFPGVKETPAWRYMNRAMQGEMVGGVEIKVPKLDGTELWMRGSYSPLKDSDGKVIGVVGVGVDVTQQKKDEEELRRLRNYLSNIIDSMPSVLVGVDSKGRVTQWNKRAEQVTGIRSENARFQPLAKVFSGLSIEMERIQASIRDRQVLHNSKAPSRSQEETRYEDITIYPLVANGVEGAVIRVDDVTEQVRLEELMIQNEKMLSVGGLAAGMAHEINNPLAGIIQTANVMRSRLEQLELPANIRAAEEAGASMDVIMAYMEKRSIFRMLDAIDESGKRVAEIVKNMLSFARKSNETFSLHHPVHLMDKILELASTDYDLKKQQDFKTIKIIKEYEENLPEISCEGTKIQQVLLNILRNGAHAMQSLDASGGYTPCFVLRLAREENMLRMEIQDNGPGMDKATVSRIFEPFFTTKPVGEGTGLGLSVSYFIITQNHGGTMDVVSSPGNGANFIIRLPLAHVNDNA